MGTQKIIIKKSTVASKAPVATDLDVGELAVNTADAKIYTKHNDGTVKEIGQLTKAGIEAVLTGYIESHTHPYEPAFTKNSAFNKSFGTIADTVCEGNDSRLSDTRTPSDISVTYAKLASGLTSRQSVSSTSIDWSAGGLFTKTIAGNTTFTFSNLQLNKTITLVLSGNFTVTLPAYCKKISGTYDGSAINYIQFHCTNSTGGSEEVWYTISKQAT